VVLGSRCELSSFLAKGVLHAGQLVAEPALFRESTYIPLAIKNESKQYPIKTAPLATSDSGNSYPFAITMKRITPKEIA
jgi:hypothetical protein